MCGGDAITPRTEYDPTEGYARVHFVRTDNQTRLSFVVDRATVCLDCGHVAFALSDRTLTELRSNLSRLAPREAS